MTNEIAKKPFFNVTNIILLTIALVGLGLGIFRLTSSLDDATNMSNTWPWAVWITFDLVVVAFSAGAFILTAVVTVFRRLEYHRIALPILLAGFAGEVMVVLILILDLARWNQFWTILIPTNWNRSSFMLYVALALTFYLLVMVIEMLPALFKGFRWGRVTIIHLETTFAIMGVVLASVHNISLGGLFLALPYSLHTLWFTPLLPLEFYISAIYGGLCGAMLITFITMKVLKQSMPMNLLVKLARIVWIAIIIQLVVIVADLLVAGEFGLIFSSGSFSVLFLLEIIVGLIAPIILFGLSRVRENEGGLLAGILCTLFGLVLNRISVSILAIERASGVVYTPHWIEIGAIIASICAAVLIYNLGIRMFQFLPEKAETN